MANEILSTLETALDAPTWSSTLPAMLAVFESGTPKGRSLAKQNLQRMAELADLALDAVKTIERIVPDDHVRSTDVGTLIAEGQRMRHFRPADNSSEHPAAPSPDGQAARACGVLAKTISNLDLPLDIGRGDGGYYIGTFCNAQPYTHESVEYWPNRDDAVRALQTGAWTQRAHA